MGKQKLQRFAEMKTMPNVFEPGFHESFNVDYKLKGKWNKDFFRNDKPIVIELGCGKGEYTVGMAKAFPDKNYVGIDIKGSRMWRGAKTALEENLSNVAFLRTRIELLFSFFSDKEISEIWITFPDPHLKVRRTKKRLSSSRFLNSYKQFLISEGQVHLKTDSRELYDYSRELLAHNNIRVSFDSDDVYSMEEIPEILTIKTYYEKMFLEEGKKITYLQFSLDKEKKYTEPFQDES